MSIIKTLIDTKKEGLTQYTNAVVNNGIVVKRTSPTSGAAIQGTTGKLPSDAERVETAFTFTGCKFEKTQDDPKGKDNTLIAYAQMRAGVSKAVESIVDYKVDVRKSYADYKINDSTLTRSDDGIDNLAEIRSSSAELLANAISTIGSF